MADNQWHKMTAQAVAEALSTNLTKGLSKGEAGKRLTKVGPNEVEQKKGESPIVMFMGQFKDFMVMVLLGATIVSAALGEVEDAITILAIVVLNAILGFVQEFRAEKSLEALKRLSAPTGRVLRDSKICQVPSRDLVPGDLVFLEAGDRVPADARIVDCSSLEVEEAALTGESLPVRKEAGPVIAENVPIGDRRSMVYSSTVVTQGRGKAVIVATGMQTELGKIAKLIHEAEDEDTPLQKRLESLGKWLVGLCLTLCAMVVLAGIMRGESWERMFLTGVSLAVAAIPEGLPAIVTIALAIGVQRMIRRNAIVRKLPAVETLGCTTVICSDKTGTLTQNAMTVIKVWTSSGVTDISGLGYEPIGKFEMYGRTINPAEMPDLGKMMEVCALCNNTTLTKDADESNSIIPLPGKKRSEVKWRVVGDPTEGALMALAIKGGKSPGGNLVKYKRLVEQPFSSDRKMMSVACREPSGVVQSYVKGAPDVVLGRCTHLLRDGRIVPMSPEAKNAILRANEEFADQALRVLGLAYREMGESNLTEASMERNLVFIGLAGMMDPPREEAKAAIKLARRAGIKTVMITGDHRSTALAVARQLGLPERAGKAITGEELDNMTDRQLERSIDQVSVFARVSPGHKLRIVKAWKRRGHIVAMTGDGVNDAPAVKEADIGVSMGVSGTDVTKEASAMILADDNYATIVSAVEEGRSIYANIRKFIRYLLGCNTGEVLTMFLATAAGLPLPLLPMQILWTNLVTDGLPALALGIDPTEKGIMDKRPRDPKESVFSGGLQAKILVTGLAIALCTLGAFIYGMSGDGSLERGRTMAFATLVMSQLVYVFTCRSESKSIFELGFLSNMYLVLAVSVSLAMQLAVMYVPFLQSIFQTVSISGTDWIIIALLSGWSLTLTGLARLFRRVILRRIAYMRA